MEWEAVFKIIGAAVLSAGGMGAIIVACVKFASGIITDRMMKKYEARLSKEIESYRHDLELEIEEYRQKAERLTFVTQKQFETEFDIYQNLFDALFDFSVHTAQLYPIMDWLPADENEKKEIYKKRHRDYCDSFNRFSETLEKSAPFIPKTNYDLFTGLRQLAHELGCMYEDIRIIDDPLFKEDNSQIARENYRKTDTFRKLVESAKDQIREYLTTLKVEKE